MTATSVTSTTTTLRRLLLVSRVKSVSTVPNSLAGVCFPLCSEADTHAAHVQRIEMWR